MLQIETRKKKLSVPEATINLDIFGTLSFENKPNLVAIRITVS